MKYFQTCTADMEDMTESRTSDEALRRQFGMCCNSTMFKTTKKKEKVRIVICIKGNLAGSR